MKWLANYGKDNAKGVIYGEVGLPEIYPIKLIKLTNFKISNGKETKNYKAWFDNDIEITAGSKLTLTRTKKGKVYLTSQIELEEV